jgi:hypothetical protein
VAKNPYQNRRAREDRGLDQLKALRALLERDGVPIAEQIRRGVNLRLEKKKK